MPRTERQRLINFNTPTSANTPDIDDFDHGEIAVRYNTDNPELIVKRTDNSLVSFKQNSVKVYQYSSGSVTPGSATTCNVTDTNVLTYFDGLSVMLKLGYPPDSTGGLSFQINSLGYKPVVYYDGTQLGNECHSGDEIMLVYNTSSANGEGAWQVVNSKNSGSVLVRTWESGQSTSDYLYFEAAEANSTVAIVAKMYQAPNFEYSLDGGETWQEWRYENEQVPHSSGYTTYQVFDTISLVNKRDRIYIKGINPDGFPFGWDDGFCRFSLTGKLYCRGNAQSLVDGDEPTLIAKPMLRFYYEDGPYLGQPSALLSAPELPATTLAENCYANIFAGCTSLTEAPVLPATTLAEGCYSSMFEGCTSLTRAPELPATTLAYGCYSNMFNGCVSLTEATELPATTLANNCYSGMFRGCTSLIEAPDLLATTLAYGCYSNMFSDCISLTTPHEIPATTLTENCYMSMFQGCASLTQVPELPATTLARMCYNYMFNGCTSLTQAPELPATTLDFGCYGGMFGNCTSLTETPELPATTLASECYYSMFDGCTSLTQAPELPATTLANSCYVSMFRSCTSLAQAPNLPATDLAAECYRSMFKDCTSLTMAPNLPAMRLVFGCYWTMFAGCTSLTQAPALPATTLDSNCYSEMFKGCTSLTQAPVLPVTDLVVYLPYCGYCGCYQEMFADCSSLSDVTCLAETVPDHSTYNWLSGVSPTGTFTKSPNMSSWTTGASGIPDGWTVQDYTG